MASPFVEIEVEGIDRQGDQPGQAHVPRRRPAQDGCRRLLRRRRRRHPAGAARAAGHAGAVAGRRARRSQAGDPGRRPWGRRLLPEARQQGRAGVGRDGAHHLPERPHRRRGLPDRAWRPWPGAPSRTPSRSTRGRCGEPTSTHPDELRIDLDPQPGTDFADAVAVAAVAREVLAELGWRGFPKTSGNRGVHIYVRVQPRWTFTDVRHAAIAFGRELERRMPGRVTTKWWKEERGETIFVDYNQNARDRTIASAYSVRPLPHAPVSAPVTWDELPDVDPRDLTVQDDAGAVRRAGRPARGDRRRRPRPDDRCSSGTSGTSATTAWATCPTRRTTRRCPASRCASSRRGPRSHPGL